MHYVYQNTCMNCGGLYRNLPKWIKNKKAINLKIDYDNNCFQYEITFALNHVQIRRDPQRILKNCCFTNQYE